MTVEFQNSPPNRASDDDDLDRRLGKTLGITQSLKGDIIEFLSAKHTKGATVSLAEIMRLYDCPADRAQRVVKALVHDEVLKPAGKDVYKVII